MAKAKSEFETALHAIEESDSLRTVLEHIIDYDDQTAAVCIRIGAQTQSINAVLIAAALRQELMSQDRLDKV